jgi:predicted peptidase
MPTPVPTAEPAAQTALSLTLHFAGADGTPNTEVVKCLLYTPTGYGPGTGPGWPLILFLHGQLEWGDDPSVLTRQGLPKILSEGTNLPALVLAPQSREGKRWWPQTSLLSALLQTIQAEYHVDQSRIYLTGISMGGYGAWALAMAHPDQFAAVVPIAGGADYLPRDAPIPESICGLRDTPVWAFHGQLDNNVPVSASMNAVKALKECGGQPLLTIYPDTAHTETWDRAYGEPELWSWLFAQALAE